MKAYTRSEQADNEVDSGPINTMGFRGIASSILAKELTARIKFEASTVKISSKVETDRFFTTIILQEKMLLIQNVLFWLFASHSMFSFSSD